MPRRPPKKWFYEMVERLKKEYPNYPPARIEKIAAGVWYKKYGPETKTKLVRAEHHSPDVVTTASSFLKEEIKGLRDYDKFIGKVENPTLKALLEDIRDQEQKHIEALKEWIEDNICKGCSKGSCKGCPHACVKCGKTSCEGCELA